MAKLSAGLLMFRRSPELAVLLVHPGGPFWKYKDAGAWSLPKGEYTDGEEALAAAQREFEEETGLTPHGPFLPLGQIRQPGGKLVSAWAFEGECDSSTIRSNLFSMEWPRGSGRMCEFPEVDRGEWFTPAGARVRILRGQAPFLDRLAAVLG
jgi:predicted NUDIX family NTP pyrophosphohydrolase